MTNNGIFSIDQAGKDTVERGGRQGDMAAGSLFDTELLPTSWMANGNCSDCHPSVFFPHDGIGVIEAQRICEGCPVASECLEYALTNHISHGVWGGASERQRRRILSARRRARNNSRQPVRSTLPKSA